MVTGRPRQIQANVVNDGLIDNLPAGAPVEAHADLLPRALTERLGAP